MGKKNRRKKNAAEVALDANGKPIAKDEKGKGGDTDCPGNDASKDGKKDKKDDAAKDGKTNVTTNFEQTNKLSKLSITFLADSFRSSVLIWQFLTFILCRSE